ncbi:MAG TPA: LysR family transcriptional regulator [Xenococcaceae cyanobacterium]
MDKFESMQAFTKVVEAGGFAAAARKMNLSRSAVNKLVMNLEKQLGVQLLYRTTRQVTPTDAGRAFYERCFNILRDIEEAELEVSQQNTEPKGSFKINAPMSFGISKLGSLVADFMAQYSEVKIQLTLEDRFIDPIAEGYDFVIRIAAKSDSPNLVHHSLAPIKRVLCAAPSYLATQAILTHPEQLVNHSCLHYGYLATGSQWRFKNSVREWQVTINGMFCSNNGEVLKDVAVRGLGIALLPSFIVEQELKNHQLQVVLPDYTVPEVFLWAVYPLNRYLSAKNQLFTQFLQDNFANLNF